MGAASAERIARLLSSCGSHLAIPALFVPALYKPDWRRSLPERLGRGDWERVDDSFDGAGSRVWFHGASVGEVGGLLPVIRTLRSETPQLKTIFSTTSLTGKAHAKRLGLCEVPCLLPLDYPKAVRRAILAAKPNLFVVTETELWPNLFFSLRDSRVPVVIINGRLSDYSFPRYRRLRTFLKPVLQTVGAVLAQSEQDAERFIALGADPSAVIVSGSTKYEQAQGNKTQMTEAELARELGLSHELPCFVAGSVRPGEAEAVLGAYERAREAVGELQLIFAPRHPDTFEEMASLMAARGHDFHRRSAGRASVRKPVLLLDTLGELSEAYRLATVSFVGGTMVDIGGHNPLEPAANSSPVVVGPYTSNVKDAIAELKRVDGYLEVQDEKGLGDVLVGLLCDEKARQHYGKAAYSVWQKNLGATKTVMNIIRPYLGTAA